MVAEQTSATPAPAAEEWLERSVDERRQSGYRRAMDLLRDCVSEAGFLASTSDKANYRRIWGRDSVIMGVGALASGEEELVHAYRRTLETLLANQGPHGEVPSNVDPRTGRVSYGGTTGRVDADLWMLIGAGEYWKATGDMDFVERWDEALNRVRFLLGAWEFNDRGLLYIPLTGDWADEYLQHGYVLYDNLLYLQAQRAMGELHEARHGAPDADTQRRVLRLVRMIRANYWFDPGDEVEPHDVYHDVLYAKGRDASGRCAGKHWMPFFSPTGYGYRFDALANVLASLLGVSCAPRRQAVDDSIASIVLDELPLLPAFHPVIKPVDDDWEDLQMTFSYTFKNKPYEFHNGGLWPLITGLYAADLARRGRRTEAERYLDAVHRANAMVMDDEEWGFPEFVHGEKLTPGGTRHQGWSAAAAVLAHHALDGRPVFLVDGHRER